MFWLCSQPLPAGRTVPSPPAGDGQDEGAGPSGSPAPAGEGERGPGGSREVGGRGGGGRRGSRLLGHARVRARPFSSGPREPKPERGPLRPAEAGGTGEGRGGKAGEGEAVPGCGPAIVAARRGPGEAGGARPAGGRPARKRESRSAERVARAAAGPAAAVAGVRGSRRRGVGRAAGLRHERGIAAAVRHDPGRRRPGRGPGIPRTTAIRGARRRLAARCAPPNPDPPRTTPSPRLRFPGENPSHEGFPPVCRSRGILQGAEGSPPPPGATPHPPSGSPGQDPSYEGSWPRRQGPSGLHLPRPPPPGRAPRPRPSPQDSPGGARALALGAGLR